MMTSVAGAMVSVRALVAFTPTESAARNVILNDPAADGAPVIFDPLTVSPPGSPAADHEYGGVPPEAFSSCEYATPTIPFASDGVLTASAGAAIVKGSVLVTLMLAASVTRSITSDGPAAPGVPAMLDPLTLSPAGRSAADQE